MSKGMKIERIERVIRHMLEHDEEIAIKSLSLAMDMLLAVANDKRLIEDVKDSPGAVMPLMVKMVFDMNNIELMELEGKSDFVKDASDIANSEEGK